MSKKINVAVIFGGKSGEHEVSLKSANQAMEALDKEKYNIVPIAITKGGQWLIGSMGDEYMRTNLPNTQKEGGITLEQSQSLVEDKDKEKSLNNFYQGELEEKIDIVLPIGHGTYLEDGKLQGMLDMLGIPYVFSGTLASALAMNKKKTKIIAKSVGLKIAKDVVVLRNKKFNLEKIIAKLNLPIVVKPAELGSSVGTSLASTKEELAEGIKTALEYGEEVLLEQFIQGRELTVAVMGDKSPKALPVIEIIPQVSGWFDYRAKYEKGGSKEVCPAEIPEEIRKKIQKYAVKIFKAIGCLDLARADFIWDKNDGKLYFLEINTIPGMTGTSLAPQAAAATGINFSKYLDKLISGALKRAKDIK
ncbi:MAG: D-alanine-D-alanine ligase [Candidatus Moranbacteria bacterium GW2011_GWF2_36_839]|nr:MAG: D-alanine-D-alanine ligase [Candidatus Moranbacteria bacterium GW2011_GWF1_36_78]KKQ16654.1 MAG: D-alanine-D-alanine ligase [Candidatus Moranbacteria bacterium GW2011_GWF2_36_839]HAT73553.1 D-alanine--D-alanine ligase A [Candidatus Moranbacteria bacterium]HBY11471.1 D-alanine--D-alanine ligase A [Candidatus Moranbacteria bacterium]